MIKNKLDLLEGKDCLVICPTRIRPEQAKAMYNTFKKTSTYNSEILFYIAEDDPRLEEYKQELRNTAYIIDKRRTIIQVMNYISCELYSDRKYYSFIGDDNRYSTRGWDTEFVKEIETKGRGWGLAYGNDLLQKEKLCGNPVISGNIIKALGYMALPILQHQFVDNFWTDLGIALNRIYYREDIIQEHLHPFANKGKMDDNYKWIYQSGVTEKDKAAYIMWRRKEFAQAVRQVARAMLADYRQKGEYKSIGLCVICGDFEKPETLRRLLKSSADYVDSINIVFNYKHFKSWGIKKLFLVADEFKAKFCYTKWVNFSHARNLSLKLNEEDYTCWEDVDDILEPPNGILMHDCIYHKPEIDCFKCQVLSDTPNGGQELILQNRLFKRR